MFNTVNSQKKGIVFNIQRFCLSDGEGIRTTVFLKGCPLDCKWCHNPESKNPQAETIKTQNGTVETVGYLTSVNEVLETVKKDKPFYDNSNGGLTLSGGEPLFQYDFTLALLQSAKTNGINTCIETSLFTDKNKLTELSEFVDTFLVDWKITDSNKHKLLTGVDNEIIKENILLLDNLNKKIVLRCPIIPTVNDDETHLDGIVSLANSLKNIVGIDIEPYHDLGVNKAERLELTEIKKYKTPDKEKLEKIIGYIRSKVNTEVKIP